MLVVVYGSFCVLSFVTFVLYICGGVMFVAVCCLHVVCCEVVYCLVCVVRDYWLYVCMYVCM